MICRSLSALLVSAVLFFPPAQRSVAQQTGKVDDPGWGLTFQIPAGWVGQRIDAGYLCRSETEPGFILLTPHQYHSLQELRAEAVRDLEDENGTSMSPVGEPSVFGTNGLRALYGGMLEGTPARAVAIALLAPQGGGVTVLAGVEQGSFGPAFQRLAESVARSLIFKKPSTGPIVEQWRRKLTGSRLTTMSSYTSGLSGGYSAQTVIHLCPGGSFSMESSSSVSMDVPGASGSSAGRDGGRGRWTVVAPAGQPALELRFDDGTVRQFTLTMPQNGLRLNGTRYYQTDDPVCE